MVRAVSPGRKRAFPRCFKKFEQHFQHLPGFGGRYRVVETTRSHQNDGNDGNHRKSSKTMIFHDFGDSQWSWRLCTGHQTLANVENVIQTFQNASETCVSDRENVPWPHGAAYLWWSGQSISWNFQKSWKIMIFTILGNFMKLTDPTNTGRPPQMVRRVFPTRKRTFPRCLKKFGTYFQHFSGFVVSTDSS